MRTLDGFRLHHLLRIGIIVLWCPVAYSTSRNLHGKGRAMVINGIDLSWITVSDLKKSIDFFTKNLGMEVRDLHEQFGWAELVRQGWKYYSWCSSSPSRGHAWNECRRYRDCL